MKIEVEVDSVKLLREALCIAQTAINESPVNWSDSINKRLGRLINELDKHRPLGPDGKHGDRHTKTCGCEDKGRYGYGDWFTDDMGFIWEFRYDIDNNVHRWFEVNPEFYIPEGREVEPPQTPKEHFIRYDA